MDPTIPEPLDDVLNHRLSSRPRHRLRPAGAPSPLRLAHQGELATHQHGTAHLLNRQIPLTTPRLTRGREQPQLGDLAHHRLPGVGVVVLAAADEGKQRRTGDLTDATALTGFIPDVDAGLTHRAD